MSGRSWSGREKRKLSLWWAKGVPRAEISRRLGRSIPSVVSRAKLLGCRRPGRHYFTRDEARLLRIRYRVDGAAWCARRLKVSIQQVRAAARRLGIARRIPRIDYADLDRFIRRHWPLGWSDREIADAYTARRRITERHTVGDRRRAMALASNALSEHRRRKIAETTRQQLQREKLPTLAALRANRFREYARERGWPENLPPRGVQILDALYERGPMTRRQIAAAVGMPWKGGNTFNWTPPKYTRGSYLADLAARGLVVRMRRAAPGGRGGQKVDLYAIPITVKRGDPATWPETASSRPGEPSPRAYRKRRPRRPSSARPCSTASASRTSRRSSRAS
jgi:hypothetical protein